MTRHEDEQPDTVVGVDGWTERKVLDLLIRQFSAESGNGPRYVVAEHVRDQSGFNARRTCDFMVMSLWPSDRHLLQGFEVKVSRSDWLRERAEPAKSEAFMRLVDRWWLVAPVSVAQEAELPDGWGYLAIDRGKMWQVRAAPLLSRAPGDMSRSLAASFTRSAVRTARRAVEREEQLERV
jgi:hypothetical protein